MKSLIPALLVGCYIWMVIFKATGIITLSWVIVLSPILAAMVIFVVSMAVIVALYLCKEAKRALGEWLK